MEWNYNSNHIEGSTLTYPETEALIYFDRTSGDHTWQEYEEMRAHDVAIGMVKKWAQDAKHKLSLADIQTLNEVILVRPFWKEGLTYDGQPTRRKIKIGEYKSQSNSVRTKTGEMFHYATPEETPRLMDELMDWYHNETAELPPISIASEMHSRFTRIHPFDDGNGRVARLIINYILMLHGYPPIVIEYELKDQYLSAWQMADAGDIAAFHVFLAERQVASLELALKAARGESLDGPGGVMKRLDLLKRQLKQVEEDKTGKTHFSRKVFHEHAQQWGIDLLVSSARELVPLEELFTYAQYHISLGGSSLSTRSGNEFDAKKVWAYLKSMSEMVGYSDSQSLFLKVELKSFLKGGENEFDLTNELWIHFNNIGYEVSYRSFIPETGTVVVHRDVHKLLSHPLSQVEISDVIQRFFKSFVDEIEYRVKELGIL